MPTIVTDLPLHDAATSQQTGTVCEPTAAASGRRIMVTGNWFASRSADGGATWMLLDPFTEFPSAAGGFCCDQIVHYSKRHRLWIWFLQYDTVNGSDIVHVAASRTGAPSTWTWWDYAPTTINVAWTNLWFDYPDVAESEDHLFVSVNVFDLADQWTRAVVLRLPFADMLNGETVQHQSWTTTAVASPRFVQGADDTMWFASHIATDTLRLFAWPDTSATVSNWTVPTRQWTDDRFTGYSSVGPGGGEWLKRADPRITAGWRADGAVGFAWTANRDASHPHAYIRAVQVDDESIELRDEPDLWSANGAWAFPAAAVNGRGRVGLSAFFGGGATHPSHVVATLEPGAGGQGAPVWSSKITATSTHAPRDGLWGD